jgi:hypothetical protein
MIFAREFSNEQFKRKREIKMKEKLKKHFKVIGFTGIVCSWTTLAFLWMGLMTASYVGYSLTAGLFGITMILGKN